MDKTFYDYYLGVTRYGVSITYWPALSWAPEERFAFSLTRYVFRLEYGFKGVVVQLKL